MKIGVWQRFKPTTSNRFFDDRPEEDSEPKVSKVPNDMPDTRYGNSGKIAAQHNVIMYSYRYVIYNYIDL
jgi:hypothetical protein